MITQTVLVIGAAGNVGQGIVAATLESGRNVVAAGLNQGKLAKLLQRHEGQPIAGVTGDISNEDGARALWEDACQSFGEIDHVVVSVNAPVEMQPLLTFSGEELTRLLIGNTVTHFIAARTFLPLMPTHGRLIGIGGGTADFIFPRMAHVSMGQAALRMMYKGVGKEVKNGARAHELMIVSMVSSENNRNAAPDDWIRDYEVGGHICAIFDQPEQYPDPVLHLRSRDQVGHPEE